MVKINRNVFVKRFVTIPMVSFDKIDDCIYFDTIITNWLGLRKDIEEIMGLIFIKLGFDVDDSIKLCNYNKEDNSFLCIVNGEDFYNIKFNIISFNKRVGKIILEINGNEFEYECLPLDVGELGIKMFLSSYVIRYSNGMSFVRSFSDKDAKFKVELGDYKLEFQLNKPVNIELPLFDETGHYSKYRLNNEEELIKYLTSLTFPISIEELYKRICELSLGDVSAYPELLIKLSEVLDTDNGKELKVTGLIHLIKGELQLFGVTRNKKVYLLDKDDNWSCEKLEVNPFIDFSMRVSSDGKKNYNIGFKSGNYYDNKQLIETDIRIAQHEIGNVRKLVRTMIGNDSVRKDGD